jgi:serine O-acetyltransferase
MPKLPPQNLDAEESVLGGLMIDKNAIIRVADVLKAPDFYKPTHGMIYAAILKLYEKSQPIDILTITNTLRDAGQLESVGGATFLTQLTERVPTSSHIEHYAKLVKEKKVLRDLISTAAEVSESAFTAPEDIEQLLDQIEGKIFAISSGSINQKFLPIKDELSYHLAQKLGHGDLPALQLREVIREAYADDPQLAMQATRDMRVVRERDPACRSYATPLLYFKGFHALQCYRITHWLWLQGRHALALFLQNRISETFAVDIHPAARIGCGILLDHGHGFVVGETAVIEDDVSILHNVTLGGTGKAEGDRHPKIRYGVLIGAGAKILGNIEVGSGAKIGAGSVVLEPVPPHTTVAGVPAKIVGMAESDVPSLNMDHRLNCNN